jgi:hypothetical protein
MDPNDVNPEAWWQEAQNIIIAVAALPTIVLIAIGVWLIYRAVSPKHQAARAARREDRAATARWIQQDWQRQQRAKRAETDPVLARELAAEEARRQAALAKMHAEERAARMAKAQAEEDAYAAQVAQRAIDSDPFLASLAKRERAHARYLAELNAQEPAVGRTAGVPDRNGAPSARGG